MMKGGAQEEARALMAQDLDPALPVMRALGARQLMAAERGEMALEAAVTAVKIETRRYIKRQVTWLNRNMMSWSVFKSE